MTVNTTGNPGRLNSIEMTLDSKSTHFCCYIKPFADNDYDSINTEPSRLNIQFEDSFEIDMLIKMLERFKARNVECWADWR